MVMIRAYDLVTLEQRMDQIEKLLEERR